MILTKILTGKDSETKNDYGLSDMKSYWLSCQLTGISIINQNNDCRVLFMFMDPDPKTN